MRKQGEALWQHHAVQIVAKEECWPSAGRQRGQSGRQQELGQRHWAGACEGHAESEGEALHALPLSESPSEGSRKWCAGTDAAHTSISSLRVLSVGCSQTTAGRTVHRSVYLGPGRMNMPSLNAA